MHLACGGSCGRLIDERFNGWGCSIDSTADCHGGTPKNALMRRGTRLFSPHRGDGWLIYDFNALKRVKGVDVWQLSSPGCPVKPDFEMEYQEAGKSRKPHGA